MDISFTHIEAREVVSALEKTVIFLGDGKKEDISEVAITLVNLATYNQSIVFAGKDPFQQAGALAAILPILKRCYGIKEITIRTPQSFIDLCQPHNSAAIFMSMIMGAVDVIEDGTGLKINIPASLRAVKLITMEIDHAEIV